MIRLLCVLGLLVLAACGQSEPIVIDDTPGTTVIVDDSTVYLTYRERFGGYTVTPYGYVPFDRAGHYDLRTPIPGYTWSKSVYWDQRPEVFGIYPMRRREVHVITTGPSENVVDYRSLGCAVNQQGDPELREYTGEIEVDGETIPATGTVCRTPDNKWKIISPLKAQN